MSTLTPEQRARQQIDAHLSACGWVVQDYKAVDFSAGRGIALREAPLKSGTCDYLCCPQGRRRRRGQEARRSCRAWRASAHYGKNLRALSSPSGLARYRSLESTGVETFFRDERDPEPRSRRVFSFHRPETFAAWLAEPDTLRRVLRKCPSPTAAGAKPSCLSG
jgi:type I restriction enzyme R subunit